MKPGEHLSRRMRQFEGQTSTLMTEQAQATREYVASQVDEWQQIPLLALRANGRNGWNSQLRLMSDNGVVRVGSGRHFADNLTDQPEGLYGIYVDCASGELLHLRGNPDSITSPEAIASDSEVFHLWATQAALGKLSVLLARTYIEDLDTQARQELGKWNTLDDEEARIVQITEEVARRGLTSRFVRG